MGPRALEARLTARLLTLASLTTVVVGAAAVVVTDRVLDGSDTAAAEAQARGACNAMVHELAEGDSAAAAASEVIADSATQGVRLNVRVLGVPSRFGVPALPDLTPGECATWAEGDAPWHACAAGNPQSTVVAAIAIGAHRASVRALARGMTMVVLSAIAGLWFAMRRALRGPLAELSSLVRWSERIAETEVASPPPETRTTEIARLQGAFDTLVRSLLDALARERANSAHIAHELRTPLTSIRAELDALGARSDDAREVAARIGGDAARLADVIEAILVLSASPKAAAAVRGDAPMNVADMVRDLAPSGARLEAPDEALVDGDERLVQLALRNLLDNARKYGEGVRLVRVVREADVVRVAVVDRGPGLAPAALTRMFDRYWRGVADGEGRGLGLALVRAVAERHGGRAEARLADGGGLDVSMTLGRLVAWHEPPPPAC